MLTVMKIKQIVYLHPNIFFSSFNMWCYLEASTHLFMRVGLLVRQLVVWSVHPSVLASVGIMQHYLTSRRFSCAFHPLSHQGHPSIPCLPNAKSARPYDQTANPRGQSVRSQRQPASQASAPASQSSALTIPASVPDACLA